MFYSEFETPGFHHKADVLEEIREVQSSCMKEEKKFFLHNSMGNWDWNR